MKAFNSSNEGTDSDIVWAQVRTRIATISVGSFLKLSATKNIERMPLDS